MFHWAQAVPTRYNKKFELMLTRLAKAYSSSCSQVIVVYSYPLFLRSRSSNVIEFGGNREPAYDFLLVINSNLGPILHRY